MKAVVLFSGGQDSTTCLAWALENYSCVTTVGFDYGQRHSVELECRKDVFRAFRGMKPSWSARLGEDVILDAGALRDIGGTAMTEHVAIHMGENGLPNTFVPGRNLLFLVLAGALAYRQGAQHLVTGVCETDYSGYPDCRDETMKSMQRSLRLGMEFDVEVKTPLMFLSKAQTWKMAHDLGGDELVDVIIDHTHTCYRGDRTKGHPWGYGCGECPSCELRALGHLEYTRTK